MITDILILLCGLALVIMGAEWLVDGSTDIARKAGLSEFLIGMTIVGIGTSLPELVVSLTGALKGSADIAIGNIIGSNIFNVFLILGLTALIRPVAITRENKSRDIPIVILATVLLVCMGMQKTLFGIGSSDTISAAEGAVFLLLGNNLGDTMVRNNPHHMFLILQDGAYAGAEETVRHVQQPHLLGLLVIDRGT